MEGCWILVGFSIAHELIDMRKCTDAKGAIFKIELEKAYDHVDLDFVDNMLLRITR